MDKFIIHGGKPLTGTMVPSGNKNAALPLMAACLLTEEPIVLHNMPNITDTQTMRNLMESMGVQVRQIDASSYEFQAKDIHPSDLAPDLCRQSRGSILLAGPCSPAQGAQTTPGGDVIGRRRLIRIFWRSINLGRCFPTMIVFTFLPPN